MTAVNLMGERLVTGKTSFALDLDVAHPVLFSGPIVASATPPTHRR